MCIRDSPRGDARGTGTLGTRPHAVLPLVSEHFPARARPAQVWTGVTEAWLRHFCKSPGVVGAFERLRTVPLHGPRGVSGS
eukprot:8945035-Alexandrium_andersonii.AAC.1